MRVPIAQLDWLAERLAARHAALDIPGGQHAVVELALCAPRLGGIANKLLHLRRSLGRQCTGITHERSPRRRRPRPSLAEHAAYDEHPDDAVVVVAP